MSRDLPAELEAAVEEKVVRPFLAVHIALPDVVRAWTGVGTIAFTDANGDPQEWIGAGGVGAIDSIGEATDGSATGIRVTLFNVPSEFREDIADQAVRGATFEVYFGAIQLGDDWHAVEATKRLWRGRVDDYRITDGGSTITVEIAGESRAIDQRRPAIKRFTNEYQQRKHPGDRFLEYVSQMSTVEVIWAQAEQKPSVVGGGAGGGFGGGFEPQNIHPY